MNTLKKLLNKDMFLILLMGISSGLPLALTGGTLQAWMKTEGVDLGSIGLFSLVGLPYTFKFVWAPLMDRFSLFEKWGRRRSWMIISQVLLIISVVALGFTKPQESLWFVAFFALLVSFFSASQDIVLDAWRRESLSDDQLAFGSSVHVTGYLFAFRMISGALALILSDHMGWSSVYSIMAAVLCLGLIASIMSKEPEVVAPPPRTLRDAVVEPFVEYFKRHGAIIILIFILLYKVGDNMAAQMTMPFYLDVGYTKTEVGAISKVVGWIALAVGSLVGGALTIKFKIVRALVVFGVLQALSTFGFAWLSQLEHNLSALSFVIAFENFTAGMGTAAFVAFMATLTNKRFTATQYALLTSFMGVPRIFMAAPTGYMAESMGWFGFFTFCALIAVPGILMIAWMKRLQIQQTN